MSFITKLKLVSSKRERNLSPILMRRNKLSIKIEEQLQLATAQKEGRLYAPKRLKTVTNDDGERVAIETLKRVKEWFWTTPANKINLSVRYGSKTLGTSRTGAGTASRHHVRSRQAAHSHRPNHWSTHAS